MPELVTADTLPRAITLLPAATEIVAALGADAALVGVTHECDYPPRVAHTRPRVTSTPIEGSLATCEWRPDTASTIDAQVRELAHRGESLFHLDAALIAQLAPDVVFTQALCDVCAVDERDVRSIAATLTPSPAVVTLAGTTMASVFTDIQAVADALDLSAEGAELVAGLRVRLRRIHRTLAAAHAPRPRVAIVEWSDPLYLAGHWVPELIASAGGVDLFGTAGSHSVVHRLDQVAAAEPDVLLIAPCGYNVTQAAAEAADLLARPEWAWARHRPVWALDANGLMTRPGPRMIDGVETIAHILHPTLFDPATSSKAIRII